MVTLNNATTANDYTSGNTRFQPLTRKINLLVLNAAIYFQTCDEQGNFGDPETFLAPGYFSLVMRKGGLRVRSALAGSPAQVTFWLLERADL